MHSDLLDRLGYRLNQPGPVRTAAQRVLATDGLTAVNRNVAQPLDRWALRLSGGRATVTTALTGLPVVFLTTTGARTGLPRTAPLVGIPIEGSLGLIGSNFGGPSHPGWVHNLTAEPRAKLRYRLTEVDIVTELADAERRDEVWATAIRMYAGYAGYRAKAGRDIRVFVARPV